MASDDDNDGNCGSDVVNFAILYDILQEAKYSIYADALKRTG